MNTSTKWTNEFLDEKRMQGDPLADRAAASLFEAIKGHSKEDVNAFISSFVSRDFTDAWKDQTAIPDPPELVAFFEDFSDFDLAYKDFRTLERGSLFYDKNGPWATFGLGVRSLLKQYAHTKAIEVLRLTTLLEKHVNRRIMETMQFVIDVMSPNWGIKGPDGTEKLNLHHPGLLSIKKLRLVHAMVRYRIAHKMYDIKLGDYDDAVLGHPINQEDMVFAIHTFSLEIIEGLREMRVKVSDEDAETYFECWKIIGRGLGVQKDLEPANYADAMDLQQVIYQRHFTLPNATGPVLSNALIDWFTKTIPMLNQKILITFIKEFNGPENFQILSDHLNIDLGHAHEDLREHLTEDLKFHEQTAMPGVNVNDHGQLAIGNFFLHFLRTLLTTERGGKNQTFRVGDGFTAAWNLNQMNETPLPKEKVVWLAIKTFLNSLLKKIIALFGKGAKSA